jgi:succinate dehydrogenase / fumarate reductase flavoprotein subunit
VVLATGGYGNVFYLSTNARGSNVTRPIARTRKGALFANPCYTQIHPTCIPVSGQHQSKLTLMSESLRNDGRVWVPKKEGDQRKASEILKPTAITTSSEVSELRQPRPARHLLAQREGSVRRGPRRRPGGRGVYLDFADAIARLGEKTIRERYGNLFDIYEKITGEDAYKQPMRIYPAVHYTMGGLWVDYNLMSNMPGLHVIGEANFSDHGANRSARAR